MPDQAVGRAFSHLVLMNITPATMFPDLYGAAAMPNLWETLWGLALTNGRS